MPNDQELLVPERRRAVAAFCMMPIYYLCLSYVLESFGLDVYQINYVFFAAGLLLTGLLFFPFLLRSLPRFLTGKERVMRALAAGAIGHYAGAYVLSAALVLSGVMPQTLNNLSIQALTRNAPALMFFFAVIAAPITEECLFRGALFGTLRKNHRVAAYLASAFAFPAIHALPGVAAGSLQDVYGALIYLAPGIALCYAYEYSGTIWTSIVLHASINAVAFVYALLN